MSEHKFKPDIKRGVATQFEDDDGMVRACVIESRKGRLLRVRYMKDGDVVNGAYISIYDIVDDEEIATGEIKA